MCLYFMEKYLCLFGEVQCSETLLVPDQQTEFCHRLCFELSNWITS